MAWWRPIARAASVTAAPGPCPRPRPLAPAPGPRPRPLAPPLAPGPRPLSPGPGPWPLAPAPGPWPLAPVSHLDFGLFEVLGRLGRLGGRGGLGRAGQRPLLAHGNRAAAGGEVDRGAVADLALQRGRAALDFLLDLRPESLTASPRSAVACN